MCLAHVWLIKASQLTREPPSCYIMYQYAPCIWPQKNLYDPIVHGAAIGGGKGAYRGGFCVSFEPWNYAGVTQCADLCCRHWGKIQIQHGCLNGWVCAGSPQHLELGGAGQFLTTPLKRRRGGGGTLVLSYTSAQCTHLWRESQVDCTVDTENLFLQKWSTLLESDSGSSNGKIKIKMSCKPEKALLDY